MLKRTKGRLLLTLLVTTGLAGTLKHTSLTSQERKLAVNLMKDSRTEVLNSTKGLSEKQLRFKPSKESKSIGIYIEQVAVTENDLWQLLETTMKAPANSEKRLEVKFNDEELIKMIEDGCDVTPSAEAPQKTKWKNANEALSDFKNKRAAHIKYLRSSTEDLRNHVVQMSFGWIDCYQLSLMIAARNKCYVQEINEIKQEPAFPK
ncbi:MAG: hypothetical protein WDN26_00910 [Chitinophagaceae bacterium]